MCVFAIADHRYASASGVPNSRVIAACEAFTSSTDDLEELLRNPTAISQHSIAGLPPELVEQLQVSEVDRFNWAVVDLIEKTPEKTIALDVLLIALYKMTGKVYERTELSNKLYRLGRKEGVYSIAGRKGLYTTIRPTNGELEIENGNGNAA